MLQDFESVSDYFTTLRSKGLVNQMRVDIIFEPIIASHLSNSKSTPVNNDLYILLNSFPTCKHLVSYEESVLLVL